MATGERVEFANSLRGLAALAVLISHYFGVFWLAHPVAATIVNGLPVAPEELPRPAYVVWLNTLPHLGWGAFGVALFFLISGFVIPFSLTRNSRAGFAVSRFFRLFPTYAVGFTVTLLAIAFTGMHNGKGWPYSTMQVVVHYFPGLRDVLWFPNIDGIVWTLEVEVKFYLVCWLALPLFRRSSRWVFAIPVGLTAIGLLASSQVSNPGWSGPEFVGFWIASSASQMIVFMFIGTCFHYMFQGKLRSDVGWLAVGLLFVSFLLQFERSVYRAEFKMWTSYGMALLLFAIAYVWPRAFRANPVWNFFANISYPLYVAHGVMGYAILLLLMQAHVRPSVALAGTVAIALAVATAIHYAVERPSQNLGRRLAVKLSPPVSRRGAARLPADE